MGRNCLFSSEESYSFASRQFLLHQGYINLLRRVKELGDYLIVGVTSDSVDRNRGKLNVRNNVLERVECL